jgi:excinuclease ABC subunit A
MPARNDHFIRIRGARVNNLKNINVDIPRDNFIVLTGLSGSGKSSLAFDTIYAEGQRRYVESLSSYARQFLGRINKPEVDFIEGIPPAIAIEQKVNTRNPRSTVGTSTEIYDYLKLLFARVGKTFSPVSGKEVKHHTVADVREFVMSFPEKTKLAILAPVPDITPENYKEKLANILKKGDTRVEQKGEFIRVSDVLEGKKDLQPGKNGISIVIDRVVVQPDDDTINRVADSAQIAFNEGDGVCTVKVFTDPIQIESFSNRFEADGLSFEVPNEHMFNFNSPLGACPRCEGYGMVIGIDEDLVVPDKNLSVFEDTIACWRGDKMKKWKERLLYHADKFDFPIHKPFYQLSPEQKRLLWTGNKHFKGLNKFFEHVESKSYKIQYRVMLSRYRGKTTCPECHGTRLKKETAYIKVGGKNIQELIDLPIDQLKEFFSNIQITEHDKAIAKRILTEVNNRLHFLDNVGLKYLSLNRLSSTLSGGESQRINLATSLGSSLVGSLYILDEPSIGLHPRDNHLLIDVLHELKSLGNTVVVVEHDEEIIRAADEIIDIGPRAGRLGGEIIFQGNHEKLVKEKNSLTADYLTGKKTIPLPGRRRKWQDFIEVQGAYEHNLKGIDVKFPLHVMTVVTGVSGSGKSTLVNEILYPALQKYYQGTGNKTGHYANLQGDLAALQNVELVDQNPIGKSSRSNPVTYVKAYDEIRKLYATRQQSKINQFKPSHFSFNVDGGRCEECQGEGIIKVEMQFMADVELVCEACEGKRFKESILEVKYRGKNIHDVLEMTINEAIEFFDEDKKNTQAKKTVEKLQPLADVGLGYVKLGQSSNTLSGGESQRIKLASFLGKEKKEGKMLFIFDEPTTGLHFHDINKLLSAFNQLIQKGNSIIIIEHNLEIVKSADWIIDLGPEGGEAGGKIVFEGTPEELVKNKKSYTANFLKEKIKA